MSFAEILAGQRRARRAAVTSCIAAILDGDAAEVGASFNRLEMTDQWPAALRRCARIVGLPAARRELMLQFWLEDGDALRSHASSDLELLSALRALLPVYTGGPLTLFRGETAWNRRRRTYGMSWLSDPAVAEAFAKAHTQWAASGSVILKADVPAEQSSARLTCSMTDLARQNMSSIGADLAGWL